MDKSLLWEEIVRTITALKKMQGVDTIKCAQKSRTKRREALKVMLVWCAEGLYKKKEISTYLKTYQEVLESEEFFKWIIDNTPKGFVFGESDIYSDLNSLNQRRIAKRELELHGYKVNVDFLKRYMRSCGFESAEEVDEKDISYIAKQFSVSNCVVREKVKEYFNSSQVKKNIQVQIKEEMKK